jgi:hypothetical protein
MMSIRALVRMLAWAAPTLMTAHAAAQGSGATLPEVGDS